ncbi:hypothetical protein BGZ49_009192 [Haplosporangium sp. Z 27]|nr:hypothetical protein BGZ49_009192 [Haplosporangium sp. Z 27]
MTLPNQIFTLLAVLLLTVKTTYASFGYCIGLKGPGWFGREVVGFQLWNDRNETAAQYRTVLFAGKTTMQNAGWTLDMKFATANFINLVGLSASSSLYGVIGTIPFQYVCASGPSILYYGCYANDNSGYCGKVQSEQYTLCRTQLSMGSDGMTC